MFVSFFGSPGALGSSIKGCPTASSSILSSGLPLLWEDGKSQFFAPLVFLLGRIGLRAFWSISLWRGLRAFDLPCPRSVLWHMNEGTPWSLPAGALSKAQEIRPALSNRALPPPSTPHQRSFCIAGVMRSFLRRGSPTTASSSAVAAVCRSPAAFYSDTSPPEGSGWEQPELTRAGS